MNIEEFAQLYAVIRIIFGISIFFGLLGWLIAFIAQFEKKYLKFKKIGIILIFNALFWGFLTIYIDTKLYNNIRNKITTLIKDPSTKISQQDYTYGKLSSIQLKNEIRKIKNHNSSHSDYGKCMNLNVSNKNTKAFHLRICKDTQIVNEYWIFTDRYSFLEPDTEIGGVYSELLK